MNEHQNQLMHMPYADIAEFFKAHPAIWFTIRKMVEEEKITYPGNLRWNTENAGIS